MIYEKTVQILSKLYDKTINSPVKPSKELVKSCSYLGIKQCKNVVKATSMLTIILFLIAVALTIIIRPNPLFALVLITLPIGINHLYSNHYKELYLEQRTKDLSMLPDFFALLITNLKINPNLENALIKVSNYNYGKVSKEIKKLVNEIRNGRNIDVSARFVEIMKIFESSAITLAVNTMMSGIRIRSKSKRNTMLTNSLHQLLKGMVRETKEFSKAIYTPILLIFGIGTIVPLIVITIVPVISVFNSGGMSIETISIMLFSIVVIVWFIIKRLKRKSPPTLSNIKVTKKTRGINTIVLIFLITVISSPTIMYIVSKKVPFQIEFMKEYQSLLLFYGLSIPLALHYFLTSRLIHEKRRIKEMEKGMIESFYILASRIGEGRSVESSIKYVGDVINDTKIKEIFYSIHYRINTLGFNIEKAFKIIYSNVVYSERVKSLVDLFCQTIKRHSMSASENIVEICSYYSEIEDAEYEMKRSMSKNIDMIRLTSYIFAPIIGALIITIQKMINSIISKGNSMIFSFSPISVSDVQLVVSLYTFLMTFTLIELLNFIDHNNEKISSDYERFKALSISTIVFTITLIISKFLILKL